MRRKRKKPRIQTNSMTQRSKLYELITTPRNKKAHKERGKRKDEEIQHPTKFADQQKIRNQDHNKHSKIQTLLAV